LKADLTADQQAEVEDLKQQVEELLFKALESWPNYADGWNNLGVYYFEVIIHDP